MRVIPQQQPITVLCDHQVFRPAVNNLQPILVRPPAATERSLLFLLLICSLALHPAFNKAACFILWGRVRCALSPLWTGRGVTQSQ